VNRLTQIVAAAGAALVALAVTASPGLAGQAPRGGPGDDVPGITPFELQRLFDSYALLQAQDFLKISDEQYGRFLPRFKALQDRRRQGLQQRTRVLNVIRRLLDELQSDGQLRDALKQLEDIEERAAAETRMAQDAVDQVLDVPQQAKFRIFEEQMERRKLELVTRARQANRGDNPNRQPPRPQPPGR